VLTHLQRPVAGTVLLGLAVDPPSSSALLAAFRKGGEVRDRTVGDDGRRASLEKVARRLAKDKRIQMETEAIQRLADRTDEDPRAFASELEKLFDWVGQGGRLDARDVEALVEDRSGEDVFDFFDALGERDRGAALRRLEGILSGKPLWAGTKEMESDDPLRGFFRMMVTELRRLCAIRARCDELNIRMDPALPYPAYQTRVHPKITAPVPPFNQPLVGGKLYGVYKAYQRACRFQLPELVNAILLCARADEDMRVEHLRTEEVLVSLVAEII
jgi:hypothetical protein